MDSLKAPRFTLPILNMNAISLLFKINLSMVNINGIQITSKYHIETLRFALTKMQYTSPSKL